MLFDVLITIGFVSIVLFTLDEWTYESSSIFYDGLNSHIDHNLKLHLKAAGISSSGKAVPPTAIWVEVEVEGVAAGGNVCEGTHCRHCFLRYGADIIPCDT